MHRMFEGMRTVQRAGRLRVQTPYPMRYGYAIFVDGQLPRQGRKRKGATETNLNEERLSELVPSTCRFLGEIGVSVDQRLANAVGKRLETESLNERFLTSEGASLAGKFWAQFLDHKWPEDPATVGLLHVLLDHFEQEARTVQTSLAASGLNFEKSLLYVIFHLGTSLHNLGRYFSSRDSAAAQKCFLAEIEYFRRLRGEASALSVETQFRVLGMGAVAHAFLARSREVPVEQLSIARDDLVRSIELGNDPGQALQYLIEIDMRLFDLDGDDSHLRASINRLETYVSRHSGTRLLYLAAAESTLRLAEINRQSGRLTSRITGRLLTQYDRTLEGPVENPETPGQPFGQFLLGTYFS